jgi:PIN domain nuclease of toxin-antitoxin system
MSLLLDTYVLLWAAGASHRLSDAVRQRLEDPAASLVFSAASLWEIAIKSGLERADFRVDGAELRHALLGAGYEELPVTGLHALEVQALPSLHRDPFDRILIAQARVERMTLLTADGMVSQYPGPIELV